MDDNVTILGQEDGLTSSEDGRIVAMRWDLIPWGFVLDVDGSVVGGQIRRLWFVFLGLSEVTLPFDQARVPNGIWISAGIGATLLANGSTEFRFSALLPRHGKDGEVVGAAASDVTIRAQRLMVVGSRLTGTPGESGGLLRSQRNGLAGDEEMLSAIGRAGVGGL